MRKKLSIKEKIVNFVFTLSEQPIVFRDLLLANSYYNEKMFVDPGKLGFRLNIIKAYIAYFAICAVVLIPLVTISHYFLTDMNFHVSIVGSILVTSGVFIGFNFFSAWIRNAVTLKLIKKAWTVHFPFFAYDKYNKKVEEIYDESIKQEVQKKNLQQYIMSKLAEVED